MCCCYSLRCLEGLRSENPTFHKAIFVCGGDVKLERGGVIAELSPLELTVLCIRSNFFISVLLGSQMGTNHIYMTLAVLMHLSTDGVSSSEHVFFQNFTVNN